MKIPMEVLAVSNSKPCIPIEPMLPRLEVLMSWWGMTGLDEGDTSTATERRFERIAAAGYDGINGFLPAPEEEELWDRLLDQYNLSLSVNAYPKKVADLDEYIRKAKAYGRVQHINVQVMRPFLIGRDAVTLLQELRDVAREWGIPAYIETHRGTITQDLIRTADYVRELGDLPLTIDLSHYVVAGEMRSIPEEAEPLIERLLEQTAAFHGRVSNGEQVQVDIGEDGSHPMIPHFTRWWESGMQHWLSRAKPGDVLPFVCELGPPPYAITTLGETMEIGDRWQQSLVLQKLARQIWKGLALSSDV